MNCSLKRLNLIASQLRGDCAGSRMGRRSAEKIGFKPKFRPHSDHYYFHSTLRSIYDGYMPISLSKSSFHSALKHKSRISGNVERAVTITGRLFKPVTSVTSNKQQATLEQGGLAFSFPRFFLREGTNMITAVALDAQGRVVSSAITVSVDQTAPLINIESPKTDHITRAAWIDIRGMVNDAVEGAFGATNAGSLKTETGSNVIHYYFNSILRNLYAGYMLFLPLKLASSALCRIQAAFNKLSIPNSQPMPRMA